MSPHPPFPIFNSPITKEDKVFHVFPRLPKELRLLIWRHTLHRERIITLHLTDPDVEDCAPDTERILRGTPVSKWCKHTGRYITTIEGHQVLSKCLRVCRESRAETLAFYRVQIPCRFVRKPKNAGDLFSFITPEKMFKNNLEGLTAPGTFYFNPEWDFINITCFPDANALIPPFLHNLRSRYDPRGIGLCNLLIKSPYNFHNIGGLEPEKLSQHFRESVEQTFRQLHEVIIHVSTVAGRLNLGMGFGISSDTWFNRSLPISTNIPAFVRLPVDPRNISNDLAKLYMGCRDWRTNLDTHNRLLSRLGILPTEVTTQCKFMLSIDGFASLSEVRSREDAQLWLKEDYEKFWLKRYEQPACDLTVFDGQEYIMDVHPAFGFWLFPLETGVNVTQSSREHDFFDMRACVPQLGLSYMPGV
jgi:hypothetical protein